MIVRVCFERRLICDSHQLIIQWIVVSHCLIRMFIIYAYAFRSTEILTTYTRKLQRFEFDVDSSVDSIDQYGRRGNYNTSRIKVVRIFVIRVIFTFIGSY